jgi:hypothetical protein
LLERDPSPRFQSVKDVQDGTRASGVARPSRSAPIYSNTGTRKNISALPEAQLKSPLHLEAEVKLDRLYDALARGTVDRDGVDGLPVFGGLMYP